MVEANIVSVFVGIESPNEASLRETKKFQNVRAGGTLVEKVHRIQDAGLEVWCGMILGFDHDDETIFDAQIAVHRRGADRHAMIGMLSAIPKTPLYDRLAAEGRLDLVGRAEFRHQRHPASPRPRTAPRRLRAGPERLYEPASYFDRLEALYLEARLNFSRGANRHWRRHPWRVPGPRGCSWSRRLGLLRPADRHVPDPALRREYLRRVGRLPGPAATRRVLDLRLQVASCTTMRTQWPGGWPKGRPRWSTRFERNDDGLKAT